MLPTKAAFLRGGYQGSHRRHERAYARRQDAGRRLLTGALNLFAVAEAYPDLKANTNFQQLQAELSTLKTRSATCAKASTTPS